MAIEIKTPGIYHIALRCSDFARMKAFYRGLLGFAMVLEIPTLQKHHVAFKDPDRIAWEFYMT